MSKSRILFVDDDKNILSAFKRQLRKQYEVHTAVGGKEALGILENEDVYPVIVADMQMPEMNGIEFLTHVKELYPNSVRLMLTGNADQRTAVIAVNEGNVFRFLNKPCSVGQLITAIDSALEQYRLITAEKELLEGTLNGSIQLLTDILSMVAPNVFGQVTAMREEAVEIARALRLSDTWNMEMATMLSHIAYVSLPPETLAKVRSGETLKSTEEHILESLPDIGSKLLVNIPRLEGVAHIVKYQNKNYDGSGFPEDDISGDDIPMESRILKVLHDLTDLVSRGMNKGDAIQQLKERSGFYDTKVLDTVTWFTAEGDDESLEVNSIEITVNQLRPGHVLTQQAETMEGRLLISPGRPLSSMVIARLRCFHRLHKIREPLHVEQKEEQLG